MEEWVSSSQKKLQVDWWETSLEDDWNGEAIERTQKPEELKNPKECYECGKRFQKRSVDSS